MAILEASRFFSSFKCGQDKIEDWSRVKESAGDDKAAAVSNCCVAKPKCSAVDCKVGPISEDSVGRTKTQKVGTDETTCDNEYS